VSQGKLLSLSGHRPWAILPPRLEWEGAPISPRSGQTLIYLEMSHPGFTEHNPRGAGITGTPYHAPPLVLPSDCRETYLSRYAIHRAMQESRANMRTSLGGSPFLLQIHSGDKGEAGTRLTLWLLPCMEDSGVPHESVRGCAWEWERHPDRQTAERTEDVPGSGDDTQTDRQPRGQRVCLGVGTTPRQTVERTEASAP
jgi:hypothetical protein